MIKGRLIYFLALLGSLVFYVAYQQWFAWILLNLILSLPWLSLLLSLGPILRTRMEPAAAARMPMGTQETIRLKVSSQSPLLPHKSKIRLTKPMTGESLILKPGDKLPTEHCGGWQAQLHRPRVCDYLGLFRLPVRKAEIRTFLILPNPVAMAVPPDLHQYLTQRWHPKPGGGYAENHEIRQYHPGDSINQIHWKLSAKAGELMLREPMEPERGLMLLTMDLRGSAQELDRKLGRLLWLGNYLLGKNIPFHVWVLTGKGIESHTIREERDLTKCVETLLCTSPASEGSIRERTFTAAWQYHIGGEQDA